jgi:hypothetical protein
MTHLCKRIGQTFEVGEYRDGDKTYDITIISYWKDAETQNVGSPVEIIGYYFGGYDEETTDFYIEQWLDNREKEIRVLQRAKKYLNDYYIIDKEYFEPEKRSDIEETLVECDELLYDRSWVIEQKLPSAFKMCRAEYERYVRILHSQGDINDVALGLLLEMAINYED